MDNCNEKVSIGSGWKKTFISLSSALTDFNPYTLQGTGQVDDYLRNLVSLVGESAVESLFSEFSRIVNSLISFSGNEKEKELYKQLNISIMGDAYLGPIARNIIKLWYTGTWYQLPSSWRKQYGSHKDDITFFVSPASYTEGLLWKAIDANPSGAKSPGYGSWEKAPNINQDNHWEVKYLSN